MPVMKCSNGEWKIGKSGDCRYSTKEKAKSAQQAYYASKNESMDEATDPMTGKKKEEWYVWSSGSSGRASPGAKKKTQVMMDPGSTEDDVRDWFKGRYKNRKFLGAKPKNKNVNEADIDPSVSQKDRLKIKQLRWMENDYYAKAKRSKDPIKKQHYERMAKQANETAGEILQDYGLVENMNEGHDEKWSCGQCGYGEKDAEHIGDGEEYCPHCGASDMYFQQLGKMDEDVKPRTGGRFRSWLEAYEAAVQNYMPDTEEELERLTKWFLAKNGGASSSEDRILQAMEDMKDNMRNVTEDEEMDMDDKESDTVTMDHAFLFRIMELMREDQSISDVKLHEIADKIIELAKDHTVTMDDYDYVAQGLDPEKAGYGGEYGEDDMEEEVLVDPTTDTGDMGEIENDPQRRGKHDLEELMKRAGLR